MSRIWVSVVSETLKGMLLYPLSGSAVISTMVHAGKSRNGMMHMLSVQRSFVLVENIFLLGIVSVGLFLIVNSDVTCCSRVKTTRPGLVCMPTLSVRLD